MKRIGVVGIVLKGDRETVMEMQSVGKFPDLAVKSALTAFEVAE